MKSNWLLLIGLLVSPGIATANDLVISEFMAINASALADEDGEFSDWLEIQNLTSTNISLEGWALTDNLATPAKWIFPSTNIQSGDYMVVFASEKNRRLPGAPLHTNFRLAGGGEYLALVRPDGSVATEFSPEYPPQVPDVSYGYGIESTTVELLTVGAAMTSLVPSDGGLGLTWTEPGFDDGSWAAGVGPVGFDTGESDPDQNSGSGAVATSNPLGYWRLGETAGTAVVNSGLLGSAVNGAYRGGVLLGQAGPRPPVFSGFEPDNPAVRLNGSDSRIQIPDHAEFDFGVGPYAIELWFSASNPDARGDLVTYKGSGGDFGIHMASQSARTISVYHNMFIGTGGVVVPKQWHHLVVTRDSASGVRAYLDSVEILSGTDAASMNIAAPILVGSNHSGNPDNPAILFSGYIDEVAIHGRHLTGSEVAGHYQAALGQLDIPFGDVVATDIEADMHGVNSSVYVRFPFMVEDPGSISRLILGMRYDDGFAAYLNGVEAVSDNSPEAPQWDSAATTTHADAAATNFVAFNISDVKGALREGTNVLAVQGLNITVDNPDFLLGARLTADLGGELSGGGRYFVVSTPGDLNGVGAEDLGPVISDATHVPALPAKPLDSEEIVVTARVVPTFAVVSTVMLRYRVMHGAEVPVTMTDDGLHGDGTAGDGIFGAMIPASVSSAGQLVRWNIQATDAGGHTSRWPLFEDPVGSPEYLGTVIADPAVTSPLPIFEWFAASPSAGRTRTGTRCSVFFNGRFYDNVFVRERGGATTRNSQKFDFNRGDHFHVNDEVGKVEEINMNSNGSDASFIRQSMAFESYRLAGHEACHSFLLQMRVNGGNDRLSVFVEQVDDEFLDRNGLDPEGALYKFVQRSNLDPIFTDAFIGVEKKTRRDEGHEDLQAFVDGVNLPTVGQREAFAFDQINLPQLMNYCALRSVTLDADDVRKNLYMYRDTNGNGEWSIFPWDKDWTFGIEGDGGTYLHHPFFADQAHAKQNANQWNRLYELLFNTPSTREMYLRRLRTVMDEQLQPPGTPPSEGRAEQRVEAWFATAPGLLSTSAKESLKGWFPSRRTDLYITHAATNVSNAARAGIPESQVMYPTIALGSVEFNPASGNQEEEYIELVNPNSAAVDISGWRLAGAVSMTFDPGTVILGNRSAYASPNVAAFRARSTGPRGGQALLVQGDYGGRLSARGETLRLIDARGRMVEAREYPGAPTAAQQALRVTEIMYHPASEPGGVPGAEEFEYVELKNIGGTALSLEGVRFDVGIEFDFAGSAITLLGPGERVLVVRNAAAIESRHGSGLPVAGEFRGGLENRGERLRLRDAVGEEILDFAYDNNWHPITDGFGFSLVIVDETLPFNRWGKAGSWRPSGVLQGTPGGEDPGATPVSRVVVNEVLTHTDPPVVDQVELRNISVAEADLSGWFLTDDFNTPKKFRIPDGTVLEQGGFVVFSETNFNPSPMTGSSFAFSSGGDEAYLFSATPAGDLTGYHHGFSFGAAENGVSFGRHVISTGVDHLVAQRANSLGGVNAGPRVGPVVISEIMYHPEDLAGGVDDQAGEYLELINVSGGVAELFDPAAPANTWRLSGAVEFEFPTETSLDDGETILVVSFDPANAGELGAFRARYGVGPLVRVLGPYGGKLDNSSESVRLSKPDPAEGAAIPQVLVDRVDYRDAAPWSAAADGKGASLHRLRLDEYGNDPDNWDGGIPSPGAGHGGGVPPEIVLQSGDADAIAFNDVSLFVEATGAGLVYQWSFNGSPISGANGPMLELSGILPEQAGRYSVVVYNEAGSAAGKEVLLTVTIAAVITLQPEDQSGRPGDSVTFRVEASSGSPLEIQWRKDGVDLAGETGNELQLTNIQEGDDGYYDAVITDAVGMVVSRRARLAVLIDPVIVVQPLSQASVPGGAVTFSVRTTGTLPMGYRWRRGGLTAKHEVIDSHESFLTVPNVGEGDVATYTVVVTNAAFYLPGRLSSGAALTLLADADADGMSDEFELMHGLNPNDPTDADDDTDNDGMSHLEESIAGTDPGDGLSLLRIEGIARAGGTMVSFMALANRTYTLESSLRATGASWVKAADVVAESADRMVTVTDGSGSAARYYRLVTPWQP